MKTIIETERIILRKFTKDDYRAVYEFNSNIELHKYTGDGKSYNWYKVDKTTPKNGYK